MKYWFRCQNVTVSQRPVHMNVNSSGHFILIDVQESTQTTVPRQLNLHNVCMLSSIWGGSCVWIGVSIPHQIFSHPLFLFTLYFVIIITICTFVLFRGCIHQITIINIGICSNVSFSKLILLISFALSRWLGTQLKWLTCGKLINI
jgi:hypothetical protein